MWSVPPSVLLAKRLSESLASGPLVRTSHGVYLPLPPGSSQRHTPPPRRRSSPGPPKERVRLFWRGLGLGVWVEFSRWGAPLPPAPEAGATSRKVVLFCLGPALWGPPGFFLFPCFCSFVLLCSLFCCLFPLLFLCVFSVVVSFCLLGVFCLFWWSVSVFGFFLLFPYFCSPPLSLARLHLAPLTLL